ncbi:hypothetical protein [Radiobacillus sp. PE A8.2]|uniref:hypothetical protein n=1 Tax=Radiobacillus sp. PE A8.2 TaxID=3380349 RepID=UPI0038904D30
MKEMSNEADQLRKLLFNAHNEGCNGASFEEVFELLKEELPKIIVQKEVSMK